TFYPDQEVFAVTVYILSQEFCGFRNIRKTISPFFCFLSHPAHRFVTTHFGNSKSSANSRMSSAESRMVLAERHPTLTNFLFRSCEIKSAFRCVVHRTSYTNHCIKCAVSKTFYVCLCRCK